MPRVKLFNKEEVLIKAMNLFWKQGYEATSIQDLVNHLGINRASLYDTFGGKEQLFQSAFAHYRKINFEQMKAFFQEHHDVKDGIRQLFCNAVNTAICDKDKKGCFAVNTATELVPNDEKLLEILQKNREDFENLFYEYLKKGQENGQIAPDKDIKSIATLLYTLQSGIQVVSKMQADKTELQDSVNMVFALLD